MAYLELSSRDATSLSSMPALSTLYPWGGLDGTYLQPPILHPDSKHYLKIGHHSAFEGRLASRQELEAWYHGQGSREAVGELTGFLEDLLPGVEVQGVRGGACVTANTPTKEAPWVQVLLLLLLLNLRVLFYPFRRFFLV